jgi:hypothetical protein
MPVEVFGAGAVQSSYVSYLPLDIRSPPTGKGSTILVWPSSYINVPYTSPTGQYYQSFAAAMKVTTAGGNANTITLPDATQASPGQNIILANIGASAFNVLKNDGITPVTTVGVTPSPNIVWILLTDTSTSNGEWFVVTFGAGTSMADAIALAGNGLVALAGKLNTDVPVIKTNGVPVIDATYRAKLVVYTGPPAIISLPLIASVPGGFYFSFHNQGSGNVIIQVNPAEPTPIPNTPTIDGNSSITVPAGASLTIVNDGLMLPSYPNWWTLGFSDLSSSATVNNLDISGKGPLIDLDADAAEANIQNIFGTAIGTPSIFFPIPGFWFIQNTTGGTGNISVQFGTSSIPVGPSYMIPNGQTQIFYADTTGMYPSPDYLPNLYLSNGTAASPALSFVSSQNTGMFYTTTPVPTVSVSVSGLVLGAFQKRSGTANNMQVYSGDTTKILGFSIDDTLGGNIYFNTTPAISISPTGVVTFPASPGAALPITSGGTGSITAPDAINNLMPAATVNGTVAYYNGTNWVILGPPAAGTFFLKITSTGTGTGGTPFWSLV